MTDPLVDSVVAGPSADEGSWHKHIVLTYEDGTTDDREGSVIYASELAFNHGLTLVPTTDDTFRWERPPQSLHQE